MLIVLVSLTWQICKGDFAILLAAWKNSEKWFSRMLKRNAMDRFGKGKSQQYPLEMAKRLMLL